VTTKHSALREFCAALRAWLASTGRVEHGRSETMEGSMKSASTGGLVPLDEGSFQDFQTDSELLTLVDFWAPWCGPCQAMAPRLEVLSRQFKGKVRFAKVDVDQSPRLARRFGVRSIPTLVLLHRGVPVAQRVGLLASGDIAEWLDDSLDRASEVQR
jgi:thioredoxin 2